MRREWKLIVVLILLLFCVAFLFNKIIMDSKGNRALVLYAMDYKEWDSSFREELSKGENNYREWFLSKAREIVLPDSIYDEVFLRNPIISTGVTNTLLDKNYHQFKEVSSSDQIYFVLDPDPYLRLLKQPQNAQYETPEMDSFTKVIKDIASEKTFVIAEYNKRNGWFDYDKVYAQKQKFKQQHELEIREAESRLRKLK
ncbi:MAG: hypothetical protein JWP69_1425 [Flaviaesturariibacter sp.]|nr:hypothetical protein [Flaviaesturariibacter sp.]